MAREFMVVLVGSAELAGALNSRCSVDIGCPF